MTERNRWYILAALLGAAGLVVHFTLPMAAVGTLLNDIVFLGMVVLVVMAGMDAKRRGNKASRLGAVLGVIYGGLLGIGDVIYTPHGPAVVKLFERSYPSLTHREILSRVALLNTMSARLGALFSSVTVWLLLGLLFAWIGSLLVKNSGSRQSQQ